ncbi:MAG: alpha/beta fold hydrolase [Actinomycetota bacterium]
MTQALEPELVPSFDGSEIAAYSFGEDAGDHKAPVLICNAVGADLSMWRRSVVDLQRERRIVAWDHRGLHASGPPASDRLDAGAQAEDAIACMNYLGIEDFYVTSWSNGARIALEVAVRYPERVRGAVLVSGVYGYHLTNLIRRLELPALMPTIAGVAKHFSGPLQGVFHRLVARPEVAGVIRQSGLIAAPADTQALVDVLRGIADSDLGIFLKTFEALTGDSVGRMLGRIEPPALLVAGSKDNLAPLRGAQETCRALPSARLVVYEDATHFLPIEFPGRLSEDLRRFVAGPDEMLAAL